MAVPATDNADRRKLIELRGAGKAYPRITRRRDRVKALVKLLSGRGELDSVPVLSDVDLEVFKGESLGVIGENGAGKSTLLKLITGVLRPTAGSVQVDARVGALLELGAGFHPDHTGRDNLRMAGALMGMTAREVRERTPEIIEFADIGRYIDEPIKHYSSGMVVRLGFALVASTQPELLITDEVLAVGDEAFQKKCIRWIEDYLGSNGTLLLVSHSMYHVQKLCQRACWIHEGRVERLGEVFDVTQAYTAYQERKASAEEAAHQPSSTAYQVVELELTPATEGGGASVAIGDDLVVSGILYSPDERAPGVSIGVMRADGTAVYAAMSHFDDFVPRALGEGYYDFRLVFRELPLLPGHYVVRGHAFDPEGYRLCAPVERELVVRGRTLEYGVCRLAHEWQPGQGSGPR